MCPAWHSTSFLSSSQQRMGRHDGLDFCIPLFDLIETLLQLRIAAGRQHQMSWARTQQFSAEWPDLMHTCVTYLSMPSLTFLKKVDTVPLPLNCSCRTKLGSAVCTRGQLGNAANQRRCFGMLTARTQQMLMIYLTEPQKPVRHSIPDGACFSFVQANN